MSSSRSDPIQLARQKGNKEKNWKEAEIRKASLDLAESSALDYFLRLAERCAEQGKITSKEYANLVDQCGNLRKTMFKIGDQSVIEKEVPVKFTSRILKP